MKRKAQTKLKHFRDGKMREMELCSIRLPTTKYNLKRNSYKHTYAERERDKRRGNLNN